MTLSHTAYMRVAPLVDDVAGRMFRPLQVEKEDLQQELWCSVLGAAEWFTKRAEDEDLNKGEAFIRRALMNAAKVYAAKDKAERTGYRLSDVYWYDATVVRDLLPSVFSYSHWVPGSAVGDGPRSHNPANEGNGRLAMLVDVKWAVEKLDIESQALLEAHFGANLTFDEIAVALEASSGEAVRKRTDRLVYKLLQILGGERPQFEGPGARRAISNGHAQAVTDAAGDNDRAYEAQF